MKTKIPLLIAASLFLVSVSKAQYGAADNRMVIQGQVVLPGRAVVAYEYNNSSYGQYTDSRERREYDHSRYEKRGDQRYPGYGRNEDHRDWREIEYDRYCHETRGCRMSREEFYRERCDYRMKPVCPARRVVVYRY